MIRKLLYSSIFVLACAVLAQQAYAEEITLSASGNGDGATNQVTTSVQTNTTVTQSNNSDIQNTIETNSDSGKNKADNNSGNANIHTGDVFGVTIVQNKQLNENKAPGLCNCVGTTTTTITDNGQYAKSQVTAKLQDSSTIIEGNSVVIENNSQTSGNSGNNENTGNASDSNVTSGDVQTVSVIENSDNNQEQSEKDAFNGATVTQNGQSANVLNQEGSKTTQVEDLGEISVITGREQNNTVLDNGFAHNNSENHATIPPVQEPATPVPQATGNSSATFLTSGFGQVFATAIPALLLHANANLSYFSIVITLLLLFAGFGLRLYSGSSPPFAILLRE